MKPWGKFLAVLCLFIQNNGWGQDPNDLIDFSFGVDTSTLSPGDSAWLVLEVNVSPGWHAYWKTAGETGYPTSIQWEVPDGVSVGKLKFPIPKIYEFQGLSSYVLEEKFSLLAKLDLEKSWEMGVPLLVKGQFSTLLCNEANCLPFDAEVAIEIKTAGETEVNLPVAGKVSRAQQDLAKEWPDEWKASLIWQGNELLMNITGQSLSQFSLPSFHFFPEGDLIDHGSDQTFSFNPEDGVLSVPLQVQESLDQLGSLQGVLTHRDSGMGWIVQMDLGAITGSKVSPARSSSPSVDESREVKSDLQTLWILLACVLIAMAAWVYGKTNQPVHSLKRKRIGKLVTFGILGIGFWMGYPKSMEVSDGIVWQEWSPQLQDQLVEDGRAVYVDFTAKWCLSCQVNKRVFQSAEIIEAFRDSDIVALRADWTKRGPVILEALQSQGREGVPLNLYLPPSEAEQSSSPAILMPEILTKKIVMTVLESGEPYLTPEANGFLGILGFALLGGLILNLMPCVFPVMGLKIMSFVKQSGGDLNRIKKHGWFFTLGVLLSFWFLLGVLLFLRETLEQELGWGFQLQEPGFVFALAVFLLIFALSLSGVFEIGLSLTGIGSKAIHEDGYGGSFFSGVLATVVATPCMAPFLGVAVGAALTMDWLSAFLVFTFIALGLSLPYLAFSLYPSLIAKLPKPGAWMDTFKQLMAFPLYATVAWLIWTLQSLL
tara:strand:+ start:84 stop:2219 length:2136 start_codon:yes stop_codon:yes gene_type:complete